MKIQQVSMVNRSGNTLRGILTLPDVPAKVPCVLLLHGFTGSVSGYKYLNTRIARDLAEQGIGCVRFDFFGSGESDGEFEDTRFTGLYEDAEDMFHWMSNQEFTDPGQLYLSGQSMGGYIAASCAPKLNPTGLLLLCPGGAMWFGCGERADAVNKAGMDFVDMEGLCYKMSFNYDMAEHPNPYEEAKGYDGPVFIARASDDELVNEGSFNAYAACYSNPVLLTTDNGGHNFAKIPARKALTSAMVQFIRDHQ